MEQTFGSLLEVIAVEARRRWAWRLIAAGMWAVAAILLARLVVFVVAAVVSDVPLQFGEALPRLGRGWSLAVAAGLAASGGAALWKAAQTAPGRPAGALVSIALLLVAGVGGVWMLRRTESFPDLDASAEIPGSVAWVARWKAGVPSCLWVIAAGGGEAATAYCPAAFEDVDFGPGGGGWSPDGELVVASSGAADLMLVFVDPASGVEVDAIPAWQVEWPSPHVREDGARLVAGHWWRGGQVVIERPRGPAMRAIAVAGPHDYEIVSAQWSPDGEWIAVLDSDDRLLVTPAERDEPRVLVAGRDVGKFSWFIPGDTTYTFALPELPPDELLCQEYREASLTCVFGYASYLGDLSDAEVRALLLVLDEEYLTEAILATAPGPPGNAMASVREHVAALEALAADRNVVVPPNPWTDPPFGGLDDQTACRWSLFETYTERHVMEAVRATVVTDDLAAALGSIDAALEQRITDLQACATVAAEPGG